MWRCIGKGDVAMFEHFYAHLSKNGGHLCREAGQRLCRVPIGSRICRAERVDLLD
jgi:hypothetical protein